MARRNRVSLTDLPDEILEEITRRVAKASLRDGLRLSQVSRVFNMHWKSPPVRRECAMHQHPFVPLFGNSAEVKRLAVVMNTFRENGNPEALFREGITNRFDRRRSEQQPEGLQQLEAAAQTGHLKARYVYGLILVCGGGKRKQEGYDMLDTLMKPTLYESLELMERQRVHLRNNYLVSLQGGLAAVNVLLGGYERDIDCGCGDNTIAILQQDVFWAPNSVTCSRTLTVVLNVFGTTKSRCYVIVFVDVS